MAVNLVKKDAPVTRQVKNLTAADVLVEARANHNELVDAINSMSVMLTDIQQKLGEGGDIIKSINFNAASIDEIKDVKLPALLDKCTTNLNKVRADLTVKIDVEKEKNMTMEGHSRRLNLIVNGMEHTENENTEEVARDFLVNDMQIPPEEVAGLLFRDVHRLPKAKNRDGTENEDAKKPIIMAFLKQQDRNMVMRKAFKLKNTDFSIKSDLPKALNELRGLMLKERKRLKETNPQGKYRVSEKGYKPVLQTAQGLIPGTTKTKWVDVKFKPTAAAPPAPTEDGGGA
ncbi:MAG: hypothetical protein MK041_08695 [Aquabacterium sp.]|nr:hypothetical protein [Aquabacterium sp.]